MTRPSVTTNAPLLSFMRGDNARSMTKITKVGPLPDASYRYISQTIRTLVYDDGSGEASYIGRTGMQMTTFVSTDSLGVDNAEMDSLPVVSGWPLEGFTQEQVLSGELDGVNYITYSLDWTRLDLGHFIFSTGKLGEARIQGTALFTFEQRSISNRLKQVIGQVDSISCRADFGSQPYGTGGGVREEMYPCGYDLTPEWVDFEVSSVHPTDTDLEFNATDLGGYEDFRFAPGMVYWVTGANAGTENEVGDFTTDAGEGSVVLSFHSRYAIQAGDTGRIRRSCTFRISGHNSCRTFFDSQWVLHYRGEPYIPIGDAAGNLVSGAAVAGDTGGTGEFIPPVGPPPVDPDPGGGGGVTSAGAVSPTSRTRGATVVNVRSYGAVGDGTTDDTAAFAAAYAALPGDGGTVNVPGPYTYLVDPDTSVRPLDNTLLNLDDNAVIQGSYTAVDHKYVIWIKDVEQVEIAGGTIRGYRDDWSPISGTTSEWGHGIAVDSSSHVTVRDCTIEKCVGDGLSIGVFGSGAKPNDVIVDNVITTKHRRQGFTVGRATNSRVSNCEISYIGALGSSPGTAPKAGIDNEPDLPDTQSSSGTVVTNNWIHHCDGPGLLVWRSGDDVTATNNLIEYCSYGILLNESTGTSITGNTIQHNRNWGVRLQDDTVGYTIGVASTGDLTLKNTFWNNRTSVHGVDTSPGGTTQVNGQSAATADHIRIESDGSSASVLTNDVIA
jgi:uncharacterized phage protein (TIGR02218 family)